MLKTFRSIGFCVCFSSTHFNQFRGKVINLNCQLQFFLQRCCLACWRFPVSAIFCFLKIQPTSTQSKICSLLALSSIISFSSHLFSSSAESSIFESASVGPETSDMVNSNFCKGIAKLILIIPVNTIKTWLFTVVISPPSLPIWFEVGIQKNDQWFYLSGASPLQKLDSRHKHGCKPQRSNLIATVIHL